jgi:long-chain acyl-CoA synthetase
MYTELATAVESMGVEPPMPDILKNLADVRELSDYLNRKPASPGHRETQRTRDSKDKEEDTLSIPPVIAQMGRKGLTAAQRWFYNDVLKPEFKGRANIPQYTHFIAVANHASHLDMGLVKTALGDQGKKLVALAAADYFFDNKIKRTFFNNFTNLVPMERKGSLRKSLEWAFHLLQQGYNLLIFPEGTRSRSGKIQRFQRGVGHLALRARVGVLPIYLWTHDALPPGSWYLKSVDVSAKIGPFLEYDLLEKMAEGLPRSAAERLVIALSQRIVEALRDEEDIRIDDYVAELKEKANKERQARQPVTVPKGD